MSSNRIFTKISQEKSERSKSKSIRMFDNSVNLDVSIDQSQKYREKSLRKKIFEPMESRIAVSQLSESRKITVLMKKKI